MDWTAWILKGVGALIIFGLTFSMSKMAAKSAEPDAEGIIRLHIPRIYNILGYAFTIIGLVFFGASLYVMKFGFVIAGIVGLLFFGGFGVMCILYYRNHHVIINDTSVTVQSWLSKTSTIRWAEIRGLSTNSFTGNIILRATHHKVKFSYYLIGTGSFLEHLERLTAWRASELKLPFAMTKKISKDKSKVKF